MTEQLKVNGVGLDSSDASGRSLIVYLNRKPTNDEFRAIHDRMKECVPWSEHERKTVQ